MQNKTDKWYTPIVPILFATILVGFVGLMFISAVNRRASEPTPKVEPKPEPTWMGGRVSKYTIEGHEYLAVYTGGIIHSESCTNHAIISTGLQ